jgi:hypothetical protein
MRGRFSSPSAELGGALFKEGRRTLLLASVAAQSPKRAASREVTWPKVGGNAGRPYPPDGGCEVAETGDGHPSRCGTKPAEPAGTAEDNGFPGCKTRLWNRLDHGRSMAPRPSMRRDRRGCFEGGCPPAMTTRIERAGVVTDPIVPQTRWRRCGRRSAPPKERGQTPQSGDVRSSGVPPSSQEVRDWLRQPGTSTELASG